MTRFGLKTDGFETVAQFMADVILDNKTVADAVADFRGDYIEMHYCFSSETTQDLLQEMHHLV
jgi:aminomethyltransferase